ncbi:hypothetical protein BU17DRAFT_96729 [Hysterangium stoloniferum]|nr:hypothetical protein BU17DRAFT_96729 [Hysterangium stoloniferum]
MHFSLLTLLSCAATLVQSTPSANAVATKFSRSSLHNEARASNHVVRFAGPASNPVTMQIPKEAGVIYSAKSFSSFNQSVVVTASYGKDGSAVFFGKGENKSMTVTPNDGDDDDEAYTLTLEATGKAYNLTLLFQFDGGSGAGFQNSAVTQGPTVVHSDDEGQDIETTAGNSAGGDGKDVVFKLTTYFDDE